MKPQIKLDKFEQSIEKSLAKGEYVSTDLVEAKEMFTEAAKNYRELNKSKRITLRVRQEDLIKLKAKAHKRQIPYQTLINLLVHQYAEGKTEISL